MAYRWKPKYAEVDTENPAAWGTCDRCGFVWNLNKLRWQYDYLGTPQLQNTRFLVCPPCYDEPQPQLSPIILPPDPPPIYNARPEPYTLDEIDWLVTGDVNGFNPDGVPSVDTITANGLPLTPSQPNPSDNPPFIDLTASLSYPSGSVSTAYLDLFSGDPTGTGTSILESLTGSATRINIASNLETLAGIAQNTTAISITSSAVGMPNINFVGIYDASSGGNLLTSGAVSLSGYLSLSVPVQFAQLGLVIDLN